MPPEYRDIPMHDFYRKIGCDIIQFGPYLLPGDIFPIYPYTITSEFSETESSLPDGSHQTVRELNGKKLINTAKNGHPVKYAVQTEEDAKTLLDIWLSSKFIRYSDEAQLAECAENCEAVNRLIGGDGIYAPTLPPSPVQELIEYECGLANFYYLLNDCPGIMERLIDAMNAIRIEEYRVFAETLPFQLAIPVENTSTMLTSPEIYKKYTFPHIRNFTDIMHQYGKKAIVHMCGHINKLLPILADTGMDGIHALTPPPVGDCPYEAALDAMGEGLVIIGVLDGNVFHNPYVTYEDIKTCVKNTFTPRIKASNFILWPAVDGIPTDLWRLEAVNEAVLEYGKK